MPDLGSLGIEIAGPLHGGHQSQSFVGTLDGERVVVKLTKPDENQRRLLATRCALVVELAAAGVAVVAPVAIAGAHVHDLSDGAAVISPFVEGAQPNTTTPADVAAMAELLVRLHQGFAALGPALLPRVPALATTAAATTAAGPSVDDEQLIHGDFSSANIIASPQGLVVLDFDDFGYGTRSFDVGSTLFMELFDATLNQQLARYETFRAQFVTAYNSASSNPLAPADIDAALTRRGDALAYWIDHLDEAPVGIASASAEWHATLRTFTQSFAADREPR